MIDAKLEDREAFPEAPVAEGEDAEVLDLLAALQRSVQRNGGKIDAVTADTAEPEVADAPKKTRARKAKSA
jgi:DNA end-binding protein Ku